MRTLFLSLCILFAGSVVADEPITLKVMSFNIWHGGAAGKQPLSKTADVMRLADIIGVQETHNEDTDSSQLLAKQLGWHHFQQGGRTAVISKFPINAQTSNRWGVFIQVTDSQTVCLFNCHFAAQPYQPYQLLDIPYGEAPFIKTEADTILWANKSRGAAVRRMLAELKTVQAAGIPCLVTGDFNEPSHLDWTAAAAAAGQHPSKVAYPASTSVMALGMVDCYRKRNANGLTHPGFTWTPTTTAADPKDHHDRIDFVYADSRFFDVVNCQVVGETKDNAGVVVSPWPSDHRAVLAEIRVKK